MQTRKIVVEIKTIDDEHCSKKCKWFFNVWGKCTLTDIYYLTNLKKDRRGYLRTAECKKGEVK